MPWIIDKDHIADHRSKSGTLLNAVGVAGPSKYRGDGSELKCEFQMFDDDAILYYEGRAHEEYFGPLDDFGTPNSGCSYIKYKNKEGAWEVL